MRKPIAFVFLLAVIPASGCQLLEGSVESSADWVAGSVRSIGGSIDAISQSSGSRGPVHASPAYRRDVRAWAAEVAERGRSQEEFLRGIGRIAESHGLTDWQAEPATFTAIGEGLADAGWTPEQMERLRAGLGGAQPRDVELVFEGWRQARS
jgi:hypothetical protein